MERLLGLGWDGLDLTERIKIFVLPLINSHVKLFPLLFKCFVGQLLPHICYSQIVEQFLVIDQVFIHRNQLLPYLLDINIGFVLNEPNIVYK